MTKKKTNTEAVDLAALEAERAGLLQDLADLRTQEAQAAAEHEAACEAADDLLGRLHAGDTSVSSEDLTAADTDKTRTGAILHGIRSRADLLARKVDRFRVPKVAVLMAEALNAHETTGLIEWYPAASSEAAGRILTDRFDGTNRVGVIVETDVKANPGTPSVASGAVRLTVNHDPLTRRLDDRELEAALTGASRIKRVAFDTSATSGSDTRQTHRLNVYGAYIDEVPVVNLARAKYTGPDSARLPYVRVDVVESNVSDPERVDGEADVYKVSVNATLRVASGIAVGRITGPALQSFCAAVEAEGNASAPAYGPLGKCTASKVTETAGGRDAVAVLVEQEFVYRAEA